MKKMWIVGIVAGVLSAATLSWANCGSCGPEGKEHKHGDKGSCTEQAKKCGKKCDKMLEGITLTDEQKTKLAAIQAECQKGECTKESCTKVQADIRAILTAEQQAVMDKNSEAAKAAHKGGCSKGGCKKPADAGKT